MENRVSEDICSNQPKAVSMLVFVSSNALVLSGLVMFRTISLPYKNTDTIPISPMCLVRLTTYGKPLKGVSIMALDPEVPMVTGRSVK